MIYYRLGNILSINRGVICHGVNCRNSFGRGLAGQIKNKWPSVKQDYHNAFIGKEKPKLGDVIFSTPTPYITVAHCFTQEGFGYDGKKYADTNAIDTCLRYILSNFTDETVYVPKIGCGLGGLLWNRDVHPLYRKLSEEYVFHAFIEQVDVNHMIDVTTYMDLPNLRYVEGLRQWIKR